MLKCASILSSVVLAAALVLVSAAPPAYAVANCGNGNLQDPEECDEGQDNGDPGACCTVDCFLVAAETACRASSGVCDQAEVCDGTSGVCPADDLSPTNVVCRPSLAGVCDTAENCTGTSGACPADTVAASTVTCRGSAGVCDPAENCNGSTGSCPADAKSSAICRAAAGICDAGPETCDGTNNACPADVPQSAGAVCRPSGGVCDPQESCDGSSSACPADAKSSSLCRDSAGVCDPAENCDGSADDCPADAKSSEVCRDSAGVCDPAESCDGTDGACPPDAKSSDVCRAAGGICDVGPESCDGTNDDCPADVPQNAGEICRPSGGVCDPQETCDGVSGACPADAKSSSVCRDSTGVCDVAESCDGTNNNCPTDDVLSTAAVCREAVSPDCDIAENCDGANADCPPDMLDCVDDNDGVACTEAACSVEGECVQQDNCEEHCRNHGFWKTHSGYDNDGPNVGQEVLDETGGLDICGYLVIGTTNLGSLQSLLEDLCVRIQGQEIRKLGRTVATAALNCAISEGGTCEQITSKFIDVSFDDCNALCAGNPVGEEPTMKECIEQLNCFNGGGKIIEGECAKGTCEGDGETLCGSDFGDCPDEQDCVRFDDTCVGGAICSEDLDAPATICPKSGPATSPRVCNTAKHNDCSIDACF